MPSVEQSAIIKAPIQVVMAALDDVEQIPAWATVKGAISNVQGQGIGKSYNWNYTFNKLAFKGHSEVIEQTDSSLVTRTTGDIDSIWTITLKPAGINSTALHVVVEYTHPNTFIELLADIVLEQLSNPKVAQENMARFKAMAEARAASPEGQIVAHA